MGARTIAFALLLVASHFVASARAKDDEAPPGQSEEDMLKEFLRNCTVIGEAGAFLAASAACDVVLNRCPMASEKMAPVAKIAVPLKFTSTSAQDRLAEISSRACDTKIFETCGRRAFGKVQSDKALKACADILTRGPGSTASNLCPDMPAANCIFESHVSAICGQTADADVSACMEAINGGDEDVGK